MTNIIDFNDAWNKCIEFCTNCHNTCIEAFVYSLQKGGELSHSAHISMLCDCIDICQTSVNFMCRKSAYANKICKLCADICDMCAKHCSEFNDDKLNICAETCKNCAKQCREMSETPA